MHHTCTLTLGTPTHTNTQAPHTQPQLTLIGVQPRLLEELLRRAGPPLRLLLGLPRQQLALALQLLPPLSLLAPPAAAQARGGGGRGRQRHPKDWLARLAWPLAGRQLLCNRCGRARPQTNAAGCRLLGNTRPAQRTCAPPPPSAAAPPPPAAAPPPPPAQPASRQQAQAGISPMPRRGAVCRGSAAQRLQACALAASPAPYACPPKCSCAALLVCAPP